MRRYVFPLLATVFYILVFYGCSGDKVFYQYDLALKDYLALPENKEIKNASVLEYNDFYYEAPSGFVQRIETSELYSNDSYTVGIRKICELTNMSLL